MKLPFRLNRVRCAILLVPAAVFAAAGTAKLLAPEGTAPQALRDLTRVVEYPQLLRGLGALEVLLAAALLVPRFACAARCVGFALVGSFTLFATLNAGDPEFLQNCGCFGGLGGGSLARPDEKLLGLVLRNAALVGMLAFPLLSSGAGIRSGGRACLRAAALAGAVGVVALYIGEAALRRLAERTLEAVQEGRSRSSSDGWSLPDISLVDARGRDRRSSEVLIEGDHLVFFSPSCPHCRRMEPAWGRFARTIEAQSKRLVLVAVDGEAAVEEFKQAGRCESLPHFTLRDPLDALRLGIESVPSLLVLGAERRIVFSESAANEPVASTSTGRVATQAAPASGESYDVAVAGSRQGGSMHLEAAVALDAEGRVLSVTPLAAGGYHRVVDPELSSARVLRGKRLDDAIAIARRLAQEADVRGPVHEAVAEVLEAAGGALDGRKGL